MNISDMIQAIKESQDKAPQPFDTPAEVLRIEGDTAWVRIPGSDDDADETPVNLTISAKEGDTVQVRVSGGTAFLVGNATAPPTDDTQAYVAQTRAEEVQADLNEQKEYFWHDGDGAHIQGNLSGYRNDLKSDGMYIVEAESGETIASFSTNLVELGKKAVSSIISFCKNTFFIKGSNGYSEITAISSYGNSTELWLNAEHRNGSIRYLSGIIIHASEVPPESDIVLQAEQISLLGTHIITPEGELFPQVPETIWKQLTASGATKTAGGFYEEGKHVYVSISCTLNSAASSGDNVTLFTGLTAPLFMVPLEVMVANTRNGVAWINDSGELHFRPSASVSTSNTVIINGHYTSA